jgi:hypothetical protein
LEAYNLEAAKYPGGKLLDVGTKIICIKVNDVAIKTGMGMPYF